MDIINKPISEIKPYEKNPRKNDDAVKYVAASIKEFGFKVPIIIDRNNTIVAGHTRYKAAKDLGLSEVPCIIADDLTDEQIKAFRLADNKAAEMAGWDFDLLDIELADIFDIDMSEFGFDFDISSPRTSYIDELLESGIAPAKSECTTFTVSFNFPHEYKNDLEEYIRENSKAPIVDKILEIVRGDENA